MSNSLRIAVVGAGIGGLALARCSIAAGYDVSVYEQAPGFARVGAGIQMAPNAVKILRKLGIEERLRQVAFQPDLALSREWDTGEITSELKLGRDVENRFGAPYLFLHRADLHAMIESVVRRALCAHMKPPASRECARSDAHFRDGTGSADAVIGATGAFMVRETLPGARNRFTGRVAYAPPFRPCVCAIRGCANADEMVGPDRPWSSIRASARMKFTSSPASRAAEWRTPNRGRERRLEELVPLAGFHPEVQAVLKASRKSTSGHCSTAIRCRAGRMAASRPRRRLHPMTPYMGKARPAMDAAGSRLPGAKGRRRPEHVSSSRSDAQPRTSAIQSNSSKKHLLLVTPIPRGSMGMTRGACRLRIRRTTEGDEVMKCEVMCYGVSLALAHVNAD